MKLILSISFQMEMILIHESHPTIKSDSLQRCVGRIVGSLLLFFSLSLITPKNGIFCSCQVCKGDCCRKQPACRRSGKGWVVIWTLKSVNIPSIGANLWSLRCIGSLGEVIYQQTQIVSCKYFDHCHLSKYLYVNGSLWNWNPHGSLAIVTI